jgi:hypothetical protein
MTWNFKGNVAPADAKEEVKGLWNIYENERGESSLTIHEPKLVWQSCETKDHEFKLTNSGRRECTCSKCGFITTFIVGLQQLVDGKIINLR